MATSINSYNLFSDSDSDSEEEDLLDYFLNHPIFKEFFLNMEMDETSARHWLLIQAMTGWKFLRSSESESE